MIRRCYLCVEAPDNVAEIDFLTAGFTVKIETATGRDGTARVYVIVRGHDDRATTLIEGEAEIPEKDDRE